MRIIKSKNIKTLNDNDKIYVNRNLLNSTVARIMTTKERITDEDVFLINIVSDAVEKEYETKQIIPYIQMQVKDIKKCFPNYERLSKGIFFK